MTSPRARHLAFALWGLFAIVVSVAVLLRPAARTVTPVYRDAAASFLGRRELYSEGRRFHYLPAFAAAFVPIAGIPFPWGEVPWRLCGLALLATGAAAVARLAASSSPASPDLFPLTTLLTIPAALSSARSGQTNLPLSGILALAAVAVAESADTKAALWLFAGVLLKPLAVVMALVAAVLRVRLGTRIALALALVVALPFALAPAAYVSSQYASLLQSWSSWSTTTEARFCDLAGLLRTAGIEPPARAMLAVRVVAGLATLALVLRAGRHGRAGQALLMLGLCAAYLMLFNPMTETNSYVILSPIVGAFAARALLVEHRRGEAWLLIAIAVGLGADSYGNPIHPWTNLWLKAALAAVFYGALTRRALQPQSS